MAVKWKRCVALVALVALVGPMVGCGGRAADSFWDQSGAGDSSGSSQDSSIGQPGTGGSSDGSSGDQPGAGGTATDGSGGEQAGPESSGGTSSLDERKTLERFAHDVTQAACEREVRCGRVSTVERCMQWRHADELASDAHGSAYETTYYRFFFGLETIDPLLERRRLADDATLAACVSEMRELGCADYHVSAPSCERTLVARSPLGVGEVCQTEFDLLFPTWPCESGLRCECGLCQPAPSELQEGETCSHTSECAAGFYCTSIGSRMQCTRAPLMGEPCNGLCAEGTCIEGTCAPHLVEGQACEVGDCQSDLECVDGTCIAQGALAGEPCRRDRAGCLGFCVYETPDAVEGVCGEPPLDAPSSCIFFANGYSQYCPFGSFAVESEEENEYGYPISCSCQPKFELGEPCVDVEYPNTFPSSVCKDGFCEEGLCQPYRKEGEPCSSDTPCESGVYCDEAVGVCLRDVCEP